MTEHAGVVRDESGLLAGLEALDGIESRLRDVGVHPDIASFRDLAHAFDLKSSVVAARATLECALERRETRGCHNRSDYPHLDPALQVNLIWSGPGRIEREPVPPIPSEIAQRMVEVSAVGKLVE
jgi:succinate dehydrogenase / fumarate reductase flavoprotein subunit